MSVKFKPDGYHSVTPYLTVRDAEELLRFVKAALGATERECVRDDSGAIRHAEVVIGDSVVMIGQAGDEWTPMPAKLYLYVEDADATYRQALDAGGESVMEPRDTYYGDRNAGVRDPAGNQWWIATHVEDVPPDRESEAAARG